MLSSNCKFFCVAFICTAAFCFDVPPSFGQAVVGGQANPAGPFSASLERRRAEQDLRALPERIRQKRERIFQDPNVLKQMNEDFIGLQTIRAEMVKTFAAGHLHQHSYLKRASADVKRRASRLRSRLVLSEGTEDIDIQTDRSPTAESLNDRAYQLCLEISRFTENPMFRTNGVITVSSVREAAKSLDMVIAIADAVGTESARVR